ncbi:unnamed protein product [Brassicogethes aeneus]|uniref:Uncharacterized protein n=1 Tax=Brassicogethes aeneus TaxID=1431903 RepID=A0A9P0BH10_BRAAE|nr:unnamed protein product [Brassicogethes aeneus]
MSNNSNITPAPDVFNKSSLIVRTPKKGDKDKSLTKANRRPKQSNPIKFDPTHQEPITNNMDKTAVNSSDTTGTKSISPTIAAAIHKLFPQTHTDNANAENTNSTIIQSNDEINRLQKENYRLTATVGSPTNQLERQTELLMKSAEQITSLQSQITKLTATIEEMQADLHTMNGNNKKRRRKNSGNLQTQTPDDTQTTGINPMTQNNEALNPAGLQETEDLEELELAAPSLTGPATTNITPSQVAPGTTQGNEAQNDTDNQAVKNQGESDHYPPLPPAPPMVNSTDRQSFPSSSSASVQYVPPSPPPSTVTQPEKTPQIKTPKIPPIILRKKARWTMVSAILDQQGLKFSKAINTSDGIKFFPSSEDDYRKITKFFDTNKEEYHTFMLPDEKLLQTVIRGLPLELKIQDVKKDLEDHGYNPITVARMKRGKIKSKCR